MGIAAIRDGIRRGVAFLLGARRRGWWSDFDTLAGASDEWVTAYVGCALLDTGEEHAARAAREGWRCLSWRRWWRMGAGWGYNRKVPMDADSTIWALRLAERLGVNDRHAHRALHALSTHARSDGGICTYAIDSRIRRFTRLAPGVSFHGWCGEHCDVTAGAARLGCYGGRSNARAYVSAAQNADGSWTGYWWHDRAFPTMLAVEALAADPRSKAVARAVDWARSRVEQAGVAYCAARSAPSPFATAACALILQHDRTDPLHARAELLVRWLLGNQGADGSWTASAPLRIPPPGVTNPELLHRWSFDSRGGGSIRFDQSRIFTTATVVHALAGVMDRPS